MALPDWLPPGEPMSDEEFREWLAKRKREIYVTDVPEEEAPVTITPHDSDGPVLPPSWGLVNGRPFTMPLPDGKPVMIPEEWSFSYRGKHMEPEEVLALLDEEQRWLHGEVPMPEAEVREIPVQKDGE